ncbi:xanthine dehydrogenase family protein molybdopterin-binding subunit [Lichenicola sp.]|uniref:xanthine dehydrogenase family protein molybdopterin-binding subunit n=1 Tax=Lichenicola sp. TaxID=2804529 RepID=UPI003B002FEF
MSLRDAPPLLESPHPRVDGRVKVTGAATFPGDTRVDGLVHAALRTSPIARGRITRFDTSAAMAVPGVLDVLSHRNVADAVAPIGHLMQSGWTNSTFRPLASADIAYAGQIVALVVAESREAARQGALALRIEYEASPHVVMLDARETQGQPLSALRDGFEDRHACSVETGLGQAACVIEQSYTTPIQFHNAVELVSCTCIWDGNRLTVHEPTRYVGAVRNGLAVQLGMDPSDIRVVSRFIGGHFGSKFGLSQHTALAAIAARRVGRPLRLLTTRPDNFTIATHRPDSRHRIRLGADADGRLTALSHTATASSSRFDVFAMEGTDVTTALYACPNIASEERVVRVDRNTPGPMRAPPEVPYLFALESAVDELAHALRIDPVELRRRNDTLRDPVTGDPFTTRPLMRCFDAGAAAFGWVAGPRIPATRRDGDWLVGQGCASAARPAKIGPTMLRLVLTADDHVRVEAAHHEIGNGIMTLLAMQAADRLDVPIDQVEVLLGDTGLPPSGLSGGSSTTSTMVNALDQACDQMQARRSAPRAPGAAIDIEVGYIPPGMDETAIDRLQQGHFQLATPPKGKLAWSFGAHFVELRVHAVTGEVRVSRHVGAFAAGRVLNPLTARSQLLGGMIWGLGSALLEAGEVDPQTGSLLNANLADYLVAVNADCGDMTAIMLEDTDPEANPAGIKGLGELGVIGVNAAIANALFDATGHRFRDLPIRVEHVMAVLPALA